MAHNKKNVQMNRTQAKQHHPYAFLCAITFLGLLFRFYISWFSIGSSDAVIWKEFAHYISQHGLFNTYRNLSVMNHPPLAGLWSVLALETSNILNISFFFIFKIPSIFADILSTYLLWKIYAKRDDLRTAWRVAALYAWSLTAILISAYHGNTDSIYAALCFLAMFYIQEKKGFFWSGLALGAALNVKLIPVFILIPLLMMPTSRRAYIHLLLGLGIMAVPYLPLLMHIPEEFYANVIQYTPEATPWGMMPILLIISMAAFGHENASLLNDIYAHYGRYMMLISVTFVSAWMIRFKQNKEDAYTIGTLALCLFLALTPGFGIQYLIAVLPLMFAANLKYAIIYSFFSSIQCAVSYYYLLTKSLPPFSDFSLEYPIFFTHLGLLSYAAIIYFIMKICSQKVLTAERVSKSIEQQNQV